MRRPVTAVALLALAVAACGDEEERVNGTRPAAPVTVTASILGGELNVSPRRFGAGQVRFIVSNQSDAAQALTFETAGRASGITASTPEIAPDSVGTLEVNPEQGEYELSTSDDAVAPVTVTVGAPRESAQDQLLLP